MYVKNCKAFRFSNPFPEKVLKWPDEAETWWRWIRSLWCMLQNCPLPVRQQGRPLSYVRYHDPSRKILTRPANQPGFERLMSFSQLFREFRNICCCYLLYWWINSHSKNILQYLPLQHVHELWFFDLPLRNLRPWHKCHHFERSLFYLNISLHHHSVLFDHL